MSQADADAENVNLITHANIEEPKIHLKSEVRKNDRYRAWTTEVICISVLDKGGNERPGCTWKIPRHQLDSKALQQLIDRSPAASDDDGCSLEFLRDVGGVDVIWPKDLQQKCNPMPFAYVIVKKLVTISYDAIHDKHYTGELKVMVQNVPTFTQNLQQKVEAPDVRAWILFGIVEEDKHVQDFVKEVAKLESNLAAIVKRLTHTSTKPVYDDRGNELLGMPLSSSLPLSLSPLLYYLPSFFALKCIHSSFSNSRLLLLFFCHSFSYS
jgi:hypothetical protein